VLDLFANELSEGARTGLGHGQRTGGRKETEGAAYAVSMSLAPTSSVSPKTWRRSEWPRMAQVAPTSRAMAGLWGETDWGGIRHNVWC
jgi:hypothetical protein